MTVPEEFGASWQEFVERWCLGTAPACAAADAIASLEALVRVFPEYVASISGSTARGPGIVAPLLALGRALSACEPLEGVGKLFARLRCGERSALSELYYAAALTRLGCRPDLEPPSNRGFVDAGIEWHGVRVLTEVISPERAEAVVAVQEDLLALANAVRDACFGFVVEVLLETDLNAATHAAVLQRISSVPSDSAVRFEGLATIARRVATVPLALGPTLRADGFGPILAAAAGRGQADGAAAGIIRMPLTDDRVRRLLSAERHHFAQDTCNVLAIDITALTVGPKDWSALIRRSFQPTQNRRIGAVVFFSRATGGIPVASREIWAVTANEHAYRPIPADFLRQLEALDESAYFAGTSPIAAV